MYSRLISHFSRSLSSSFLLLLFQLNSNIYIRIEWKKEKIECVSCSHKKIKQENELIKNHKFHFYVEISNSIALCFYDHKYSDFIKCEMFHHRHVYVNEMILGRS